MIAVGTVWSLPPAISSRGPRVLFWVLTLAGDCGVKFANASAAAMWPAIWEILPMPVGARTAPG